MPNPEPVKTGWPDGSSGTKTVFVCEHGHIERGALPDRICWACFPPSSRDGSEISTQVRTAVLPASAAEGVLEELEARLASDKELRALAARTDLKDGVKYFEGSAAANRIAISLIRTKLLEES